MTYKEITKELFCEECDHVELLEATYGLSQVIMDTAILLPDLAKEAFLFSQTASVREKDRRAKEIVTEYSTRICIDIGGKSLTQVGEMVGRMFILWGWNVLGFKVSNTLVKELTNEYQQQDLSVRLAMVAADTILNRRLSRPVVACLGVIVNKPLRQLYQQLLHMISQDNQLRTESVSSTEVNFIDNFLQSAFDQGIASAISQYWD